MNSRLKYIDDSWGMGNKIMPGDIDWLITQVKDLRNVRIKDSETIREIKKENDELKEQLNQHIHFLDKHHKGWEDKWNINALLSEKEIIEKENKRNQKLLKAIDNECEMMLHYKFFNNDEGLTYRRIKKWIEKGCSW